MLSSPYLKMPSRWSSVNMYLLRYAERRVSVRTKRKTLFQVFQFNQPKDRKLDGFADRGDY